MLIVLENEMYTSNESNSNKASVTYGKSAMILQSTAKNTYRKPVFVDKLEGKFQWSNLPAETIEDVGSSKDDYYDGSKNLEYYNIFCDNFSKLQNVCETQEQCGFCLSLGKCIHGTDQGPVTECKERHFSRKGKLI